MEQKRMENRFILEYNKYKNSRCEDLDEKSFLDIFFRECSNFSFENDQLWRGKGRGGLQIFRESERRSTIGQYSYKDFFDLRREYPVPRYKSLIGSTTLEGAKYFGMAETTFLVMPFNNSNIVFAGCPDIAMWTKVIPKIEFTDDLFIMKQYEKDFKVPNNELFKILSISKPLSDNKRLAGYGYEFFTNSNCLLLPESKIDWLKSVISC